MRPDLVALAKGYPYAVERRSFVFSDGAVRPAKRLHHPDRIPIVAYGSNRSVEQLARKYRAWPKGTEIPVTLARLGGHDVVYSAHFARYGAMPAMLFPVPEVFVEVSVVWLTEGQLARMHQTEGASNYRFAMRHDVDLVAEDGRRIERAGLYTGRHGALSEGGRPVLLAAIAADGRRDAGCDQAAALSIARDRLAPEAALDAFILQNVACPVTRADRGRRLRRDAIQIAVSPSLGLGP